MQRLWKLIGLCLLSIPLLGVRRHEEYDAQAVREALYYEFGRLPPEYESLARRIQQECSIYRDIVYVCSPQGWGGTGIVNGVLYMRVLTDERKHLRLFVLHHEMGHLAHHDLDASNSAKKALLKRVSGSEYQEEHARIRKYRSLGKKALSKKTHLGAVLNKRIAATTYTWRAPTEKMARALMRAQRWYEQQADLFAYERLYQAQEFDALCYMAYTFGLTQYDVVEGDEDAHPSDLERALYLIGFLVSQKVAVEKLFLEYEARLLAHAGKENALDYLKRVHKK